MWITSLPWITWFSHKSWEERGKEHDTSPLRGCDPDKHVYALGSFISEFNKACFRSGKFQWEIQFDVTAITYPAMSWLLKTQSFIILKPNCQRWSLALVNSWGSSFPLASSEVKSSKNVIHFQLQCIHMKCLLKDKWRYSVIKLLPGETSCYQTWLKESRTQVYVGTRYQLMCICSSEVNLKQIKY